ncbi:MULTISPECIES: hypothetical protein [unclassified Methylobacterium]|uniref:hypothetical protein n=1 Tax=unclassified Methylobacterium TaxID=2615210 RepID=UPI000EC8E05C|nr:MULTISPECIES: hypothetical protein [unclassified Methylobacterium]GBU19237.1 hypothetical protein AwMethylo_34520 [Methylobacterium sp.]
MENGDYRGMSDRKWREQTGGLSPVEATQAAVDRIKAGKTTLDEACEWLGRFHEAVRAQMEAERRACQELSLCVPAWQAGPDGVPADRDVWAYVYNTYDKEDIVLIRGRYDARFREFEPAGSKGSLSTSVLAWIDTEEQPAFGIEAVRACIASLQPLSDNCHDEIAHMAEDWLHREALRAVVAGHPDAQAIAAAALESRAVKFTRYYS